jgi:hypothetical protein
MSRLLVALALSLSSLSATAHAGTGGWGTYDAGLATWGDATCDGDDVEMYSVVDAGCATECEDTACGTVDAECFADCVIADVPGESGCTMSRDQDSTSTRIAETVLPDFPNKGAAMEHCVASTTQECGVDMQAFLSCMESQRFVQEQRAYAKAIDNEFLLERTGMACSGYQRFDEEVGVCVSIPGLTSLPPSAPPEIKPPSTGGGTATYTQGQSKDLRRSMCKGEDRPWDARTRTCGPVTKTGSIEGDRKECIKGGLGYDEATGECGGSNTLVTRTYGTNANDIALGHGLANAERCIRARNCFTSVGVLQGTPHIESESGFRSWDHDEPWLR